MMEELRISLLLVLAIINGKAVGYSYCGCKEVRYCYALMLYELHDMDEEICVEDAAIGTSTVTVFLKALSKYCPDIVNVTAEEITHEGRLLYEVVLHTSASPKPDERSEPKPVVIIDAGQLGGTESVAFALFLIEQLVACTENEPMIKNVKWVIMPCTNPDGQEFTRYNTIPWKKNLKPIEGQKARGVDISRNFDSQWGSCPKVETAFSQDYPGDRAGSEVETQFIKSVMSKYKTEAKLYLSIKCDGHHILYPHGYTSNIAPKMELLLNVAGEVANRVNLRATGLNVFKNTSIFDFEGKAYCGNSVDYAHDMGIPLAFEMRIFFRSNYHIISEFQQLPRNHETSLRNSYFSGIRELYNAVTNEKKYGTVP